MLTAARRTLPYKARQTVIVPYHWFRDLLLMSRWLQIDTHHWARDIQRFQVKPSNMLG
jgi:hypothetical protein